MNFPPLTILAIVVGAAAYFFAIYSAARAFQGWQRVVFRYAALVVTLALFFLFIGYRRYVGDHARAADLTQVMIAITAAGAVFYEQHRPVAERWKRAVGVTLGIAGIIVYFNGFKFGYARYHQRWDQSHRYMGAKCFREMGYARPVQVQCHYRGRARDRLEQ
jgi:ribose/xylose/arabinose/galactoside ABC-type transport system permease subunit